jgi:hypothetical protein
MLGSTIAFTNVYQPKSKILFGDFYKNLLTTSLDFIYVIFKLSFYFLLIEAIF